jgi:hypothetical protein
VNVEREDSPKPGGENHKPAANPGQERAVALVAQKSQNTGPHDTMLGLRRGILTVAENPVQCQARRARRLRRFWFSSAFKNGQSNFHKGRKWRRWRDFKINFVRGFKPPEQWRSFQTRYIGRAQGKTGELSRQFTARFAETPLQALHNFAVGIAVARITRIMAAWGLDPCFGFLHDGRKLGRFSLAWDAVEVFRPVLATAVVDYTATKKFEQANFASQDGVVRLSPWIARESATVACTAAPLAMLAREVKKIETLLRDASPHKTILPSRKPKGPQQS